MKNGKISREGKSNGQESSMNQKSKKSMKKKNRSRMGGGKNGGGLSLEAFATAKTKTDHYNPAFIKKQKEFYKTAKYVSKFKKSMKQQNQDRGESSTMSFTEDTSENKKTNEGKRTKKKPSGYSLKEVYEKKCEEEEQARMEREAIIRAKKEETERAQSRRKALREKMFKKTKSGQPVMKYRIEHLLETIQSSSKD